jgi:ABC-type transport system substrate-binding protein
MIRIPPNGAKFHSEKLTELFTKLQGTPAPADREGIARDIAKSISTEIPAIFLFNYVDIYGIKDDIDWTPRFDQYVYVDEVGLRKS